MLDSTARAERLDLTSSEPAIYTWEVAQKPVAVRLPMALMDRMEAEAVETFRSLSSRGSEIGGLLLGSVAAGTPSLVTLADFELIACDYSRGPLYRLSDADMGRFEQAIQKHSGGASQRVIGYFRSHTRKGLVLDAEDISFFEPRFLEPQNFILLIRPFATKASTAGIFIRENGRIGETSHLEFPFRSSELTGSRNGAEKTEPASGQTATATSTSSASAKSQPRAQIVPIASRREITLPETTPAAAQPAAASTAAPAASDVVETPAPAPATPAKIAAPAATPAKSAATPAKSAAPAPAVEAEKTPAPSKPVTPEVKSVSPALPSIEILAAPPKNKKLRLVVAAAIGMLILVGGSLVVVPSLRNRFISHPPAAQQDSSPLSLRVERTTGGMLLTWNRDLAVIQRATKVVLSITDGDRHANVELDPNQVRTGSIVYPPITGDVSFQMEVTDGKNTKTTSESLRVLDPRPSPLADPSDGTAAKQAAAANAKPAITTPTPTAAETTVAEGTKQPEESTTPRSSTPLRAFNAQSLGQRLRPPSPTDLPDAPAIVRASAPTNNSLPGIVPSQAIAPPPAPKSGNSTPTATPNSQAPLEVGGQLRPAVVVTRVDPEYPRLARQAGASGIVELEATIGVDGKVKNPRVIKGNAMLQKPAVDAVLQWRYKPAMLNGKPVESPVEIKLNFVPAH